jgi:hypothetical protein
MPLPRSAPAARTQLGDWPWAVSAAAGRHCLYGIGSVSIQCRTLEAKEMGCPADVVLLVAKIVRA